MHKANEELAVILEDMVIKAEAEQWEPLEDPANSTTNEDEPGSFFEFNDPPASDSRSGLVTPRPNVPTDVEPEISPDLFYPLAPSPPYPRSPAPPPLVPTIPT